VVDLGVATGYVVVFSIIGFLELFDRTSFALIALAARAKPLPTFLGGALAFVATTVLSVTVGAALVDLLGPTRIGWLRVAGGAILLSYAAWLYVHPEDDEEGRRGPPGSLLYVAFATVFLLELADTTMIFEIVFVAAWGWFIVLVAGAAALVTVAAWDVFLGNRLGLRVDPELLRKIVIVVLAIVGVVTIVYGLAPAAFPTLGFLAGA
jgi:putative Ca2+/H+ antiporter (TMEM165/GDT1 family)